MSDSARKPKGHPQESDRKESEAGARAPYLPPRLEPLGKWKALTLQQSVPIGPGSFGLGE